MDCEENADLNNIYFLYFFLHDFYNILFYFFVSVAKAVSVYMSLTKVIGLCQKNFFSIYRLNLGVYSRWRFTLASDKTFLNSLRWTDKWIAYLVLPHTLIPAQSLKNVSFYHRKY